MIRLLIFLAAFFVKDGLQAAQDFENSSYRSSSHFRLFCEKDESAIADLIITEAEKAFEKISIDLQHEWDSKKQISIRIYPDLQALHEAIGWKDAPDWLVGTYRSQSLTILLVSPHRPGPRHTFESIFCSLKHNLAAAFIQDKYKQSIPRWMRAGIAMHEADQLFLAKRRLKQLSQDHTLIPTLCALETESLQEFEKCSGYACSYALIDFLQERWSWEAVLTLANDYAAFEHILQISQDRFYRDWIHFIDEKYGIR